MPTVESSVKLDFSDVLLKPKRSEIASRNDVFLERSFTFKYSQRQWTGIPIIVANMDTTGTIEMALELQKHKVLTCLHKYYRSDELLNSGLDKEYYAVSTGISDKDLDNLDEINWIGADQRGLVLEIHGFIEEGVLHIIHVMPHRFRRNR
jgi:GMP reductase